MVSEPAAVLVGQVVPPDLQNHNFSTESFTCGLDPFGPALKAKQVGRRAPIKAEGNHVYPCPSLDDKSSAVSAERGKVQFWATEVSTEDEESPSHSASGFGSCDDPFTTNRECADGEVYHLFSGSEQADRRLFRGMEGLIDFDSALQWNNDKSTSENQDFLSTRDSGPTKSFHEPPHGIDDSIADHSATMAQTEGAQSASECHLGSRVGSPNDTPEVTTAASSDNDYFLDNPRRIDPFEECSDRSSPSSFEERKGVHATEEARSGVVIVDWDDTLFPSSWLNEKRMEEESATAMRAENEDWKSRSWDPNWTDGKQQWEHTGETEEDQTEMARRHSQRTEFERHYSEQMELNHPEHLEWDRAEWERGHEWERSNEWEGGNEWERNHSSSGFWGCGVENGMESVMSALKESFKTIRKNEKKLLKVLENSALNFLIFLKKKVDRIFIVTNAELGWVQFSSSLLMPQLFHFLRVNDIPIISARSCSSLLQQRGLIDDCSENPDAWKEETFRLILKKAFAEEAALRMNDAQKRHPQFFSGVVTSTTDAAVRRKIPIISIGDSDSERRALLRCREEFYDHGYFQSIKLVEAPHPVLLVREQRFLRHQLSSLIDTSDCVDLVLQPSSC